MNQHTPKLSADGNVGRKTAWLLFDAFAFVGAMYKGIEFALLRVDGVASQNAMIAVEAAVFVALLALRIGYGRVFGKKVFPGVVVELGLAGAFIAALAKLSLKQDKAVSVAWLPLEWHKLPDNHFLLASVTPTFCVILLGWIVFAVWQYCKGWRKLLMLELAALIGVTLWQCSILTKEPNFIHYFILYVAPLLGALAAAVLRRERLGARAIVFSAATLILIWHYIGWVPVIFNKSFVPAPGVERLYPKEGEKAEYPLSFLRDIEVDPEQKNLYSSYGPSSGMIRLDLETRKLTIEPTPIGLVRYVSLDPEHNRLFALDWLKSDLITATMEPFKITERQDLYFAEGLFVPMFFIMRGDRMYATYTEPPSAVEFDRDPLRISRKIMFRDMGLIQFRSGVWKFDIDDTRNKMYAEVGMTDANDQFLLTRIDLDRFELDGKSPLPEGGLELIAIPEKGRVIAPSFFSRNMYEYDADTMEPTRVLRGPLSCRNLVYDTKHNLLIGTGFLSGEVVALDFDTGKTVAKAKIGNKAQSLYITPDGEEVYLGSSWGIFRIKLDEFLKNANR